MSTEAVALANLAAALAQGPTEEERWVQAGIDATMRAVAADRYNPALREGAPRVTVVGAVPVRGSGWAEPRPIESPMPKGSFVEGVVGGMIDRALGPAAPKEEGQ